MNRFLSGLVLVCALVAAWVAVNFNPASLVGSQQRDNDALLEQQMASHIGALAYLYGYPLVDMQRQMHNETHRLETDQQVYAPLNRLYRFPEIVGPDNAGNLRAPNNDTLYYSGWFDISRQPLVIHVPDTAGRYYTIAITNQYSEVTHIGRRTTGTAEGYFALVGPAWKGQLPEGVTPIEVETPRGWLLGRMLVQGPDDFDPAMALVDAIWLAGLDEFTPGKPPPLPQVKSAQAIDPMDTLEFFRLMNRALKTLPQRPQEAALMAQFDAIGIGPNSDFDPEALSESERLGLEQALQDGRAMVDAARQRTIPDYNGWMISHKIGRYGFDYMHRASVVAGGYGNLPEESLYPAVVFDSDGKLMDGSNRYSLHFEAGNMPPVNGFWSLAAYRLGNLQLESNEIERYSIGDRTAGLRYNEDGSLTLWLQHERPQDPHKNWLPVPGGKFMSVMRLYEPARAALDNEYLLPKIERQP